jgi:hypothetical protein
MFRCKLLLSFVAMLLMSANALALPVTMTANDAMNTTSFNTAGKWSDLSAPSAGNTYSTLGWLLRSPTAAGSYTFAGYSLTVGGGTAGGTQPFLMDGNVNNNSLIFKAANCDLTVSNLILDAGTIRDGLGTNQACSMNGNIFVTGNGGGFAAQCLLSINSAINGSGPIYIADNGSGEAGRTVIFTSGLNTYNGNIKLVSKAGRVGSNYSRLTFADNSLMNFVIGANGVNNSISGTGTATFNGDFWFNLAGANTTLGNSWLVASATSQTFSDTFTVLGFTSIGATVWTKTIDPTKVYAFSEATGKLIVVPEPATMALLGLGGLSLLRIRKRR